MPEMPAAETATPRASTPIQTPSTATHALAGIAANADAAMVAEGEAAATLVMTVVAVAAVVAGTAGTPTARAAFAKEIEAQSEPEVCCEADRTPPAFRPA